MKKVWFILFGFLFFYFGIKLDIQLSEIRNKCDVVESSVILADKVAETRNINSKSHNDYDYSQNISVEFDYNDCTYTHNLGNINVSNSKGYVNGDKLKVFVNRNNPKEVYLYKSRIQSYISYAVALILIGVGVIRKRDSSDKKQVYKLGRDRD